MTAPMFLMLLAAFSSISGLITEGIKKLISDKKNLSYNLLALIVSLIVGGIGCVIYYQLTGIPYTTNNIIYIVLMGFASALSSMVGYDKIKQMIQQFSNNQVIPETKEEIKTEN